MRQGFNAFLCVLVVLSGCTSTEKPAIQTVPEPITEETRPVIEQQDPVLPSVKLRDLPTELVKVASPKKIALTFDGGSGDEAFHQTLDLLKKYDLRVTVFLTGQFIERFPMHLERLKNEGHEIGHHSYSHPNFRDISDEEVRMEMQKTQELFLEAGVDPRPLFRYPLGARNARTNRLINSLGYKSIFWSIDTIDWRDGKEKIRERLLKAKGGDIVLAHLGNVETPLVLEEAIRHYLGLGLEIVTISDLVASVVE